MNCKPGDMARIVWPHFRAGTFVSVLSACAEEDFQMLCTVEPEWRSETGIWLCSLATGTRGINDIGLPDYFLPGDEVWVVDRYLQPIRPQADDHCEENLDHLPVRIKEAA